jgi:hypothetical protein
VVVVAALWPEFERIPTHEWANRGAARTVIDCWRGLPYLGNADGVRYICLGIGGGAPKASSIPVGA